jgi:hypothetical protein
LTPRLKAEGLTPAQGHPKDRHYAEVVTESGTDGAAHWDLGYQTQGATGVSWFEPVPVVSLELVEALKVPTDAAVIDVGGGASTLVDSLIELGFGDLSVLDISESALEAARVRLAGGPSVGWLQADVLAWQPERRFDLWHDRAVFHFLVEKADRDAYLAVLNAGISRGGAIVMGTFAEDGPEYCSGLPVARYAPDDLVSVLGDGFEVVETRQEKHVTPAGGSQAFSWIAARRVDTASL